MLVQIKITILFPVCYSISGVLFSSSPEGILYVFVSKAIFLMAKHSQEHSFSTRFCNCESNKIAEWLNHTI